MSVHQPVLDAEPADVLHRQQQDAPAAVDGHLRDVRLAILLEPAHHRFDVESLAAALAQPRADAIHGLRDPRPRERLEQVVDGAAPRRRGGRTGRRQWTKTTSRRRRSQRAQDREAVQAAASARRGTPGRAGRAR